MHCIWCGVPRDYYFSIVHSQRQNCRESNSGYHQFGSNFRIFDCLYLLFNKQPREELLEHRRQKRPHTI